MWKGTTQCHICLYTVSVISGSRSLRDIPHRKLQFPPYTDIVYRMLNGCVGFSAPQRRQAPHLPALKHLTNAGTYAWPWNGFLHRRGDFRRPAALIKIGKGKGSCYLISWIILFHYECFIKLNSTSWGYFTLNRPRVLNFNWLMWLTDLKKKWRILKFWQNIFII